MQAPRERPDISWSKCKALGADRTQGAKQVLRQEWWVEGGTCGSVRAPCCAAALAATLSLESVMLSVFPQLSKCGPVVVLQKICASAVSVCTIAGMAKEREIVLQGNFAADIEQHLVVKKGLPRSVVEVTHGKGVKSKR